MINKDKTKQIARNIAYNLGNKVCNDIKTYGYEDVYNAALQAIEWKDEQHEQEKQQIIDKAMKVICNGCAQKAECEFNNWKTCSTKNELINAMKEE